MDAPECFKMPDVEGAGESWAPHDVPNLQTLRRKFGFSLVHFALRIFSCLHSVPAPAHQLLCSEKEEGGELEFRPVASTSVSPVFSALVANIHLMQITPRFTVVFFRSVAGSFWKIFHICNMCRFI